MSQWIFEVDVWVKHSSALWMQYDVSVAGGRGAIRRAIKKGEQLIKKGGLKGAMISSCRRTAILDA